MSSGETPIAEGLKTLYYLCINNPGEVETTTGRLIQLIERTSRAEDVVKDFIRWAESDDEENRMATLREIVLRAKEVTRG